FFALACSKHQYSLPEDKKDFKQNVTYNNKVDILLMIDNSSSMGLYQDRLASQVGGMISALDSLGMDYQIAVATSDMRAHGNGGMFVGSPRILNKSTPSLEGHLRNRIQIGTSGSDLERGLES